MFNFKQYDFKRYNVALLIIVIILGLIGAFLIKQVQTEAENLFVKHLVGLAGGVMIALIVSLFDYHFISGFYIILYIVNLVLLVLVKVMGSTLNSSERWLDLGFIKFQPSELTKIILIIFAAKMFTIFRQKINNLLVLALILISIAIPIALILSQPNLSTSLVVMFIFVTILFAAGLSWKIILPVLVIGLPIFFGLFWYIQQDYQVLISPYQQGRILTFIHPEQYPDKFFQQENSVQAIGSGQLYGKIFDGPGSRNYDEVPISESDFIFSVAGEEFGFIGSIVLIVLYAVLVYICLMTARSASDYLGMLIAIGIASMFAFQVFVNIGVATALLPNTGIPLPFVSAGLSSMVSGMLGIGLLLNIRLQPRKARSV